MSKHLSELITETKIPGISVASVSSSGEITRQIGGVTNASSPQAVTHATVFEVASLSKPVFAFIVLKMIERGKLSRLGESPESGLDRPLHEIAEFGPPHLRTHPYYKLLTPRLVLSHQAGLPNWFQRGQSEEYKTSPGKSFDYSGVAFYFLNDVIEKTSEKSLEVLAQEIFKELKMNNSSFLSHEEGTEKRKNRAIGHDSDGTPDKIEHFPRKFGPNPAASLITTADDYAKFLRSCATDKFIRKYMFESQVELADKDKKAINAKVPPGALGRIKWGIGMGLQTDKNGATIAFHWGDCETFRAFTAMNLQTNKAVVCLTNSANGPLAFQEIAEPVVGNLAPVSEWLSCREGLKLHVASELYPPQSESRKTLSSSVKSQPDVEVEKPQASQSTASILITVARHTSSPLHVARPQVSGATQIVQNQVL